MRSFRGDVSNIMFTNIKMAVQMFCKLYCSHFRQSPRPAKEGIEKWSARFHTPVNLN